MGFGAAGAAAVLGLAFLAVAVGLASAVFGAAEKLDEAERDAWARRSEALRTAADIVEVKLIGAPSKLYVIADDTGDTTIDPRDLDVLLDGVHRTDKILNWTADGVASGSVWPPGTRLYLRLDVTTVPTRAVLVSGNGVATYWGS